jgi:molybdopterin converting factor small subunit
MMEKERDRSRPKDTEHRVTVSGRTVTVKLPAGKKRANDLLSELKSRYKEELKNFRFDKTVAVVLDGKAVTMNDEGEIEGNPLLSASSTLSLMPKITGGIS